MGFQIVERLRLVAGSGTDDAPARAVQAVDHERGGSLGQAHGQSFEILVDVLGSLDRPYPAGNAGSVPRDGAHQSAGKRIATAPLAGESVKGLDPERVQGLAAFFEELFQGKERHVIRDEPRILELPFLREAGGDRGDARGRIFRMQASDCLGAVKDGAVDGREVFKKLGIVQFEKRYDGGTGLGDDRLRSGCLYIPFIRFGRELRPERRVEDGLDPERMKAGDQVPDLSPEIRGGRRGDDGDDLGTLVEVPEK